MRRLLIVFTAVAGVIAGGCGDADPAAQAPASATKPSSVANAETLAPKFRCPFDAEDVSDIAGVELEDMTDDFESTILREEDRAPQCTFAVESRWEQGKADQSYPVVRFSQLPASDLEKIKKLYEQSPGKGGRVTARDDLGADAFLWETTLGDQGSVQIYMPYGSATYVIGFIAPGSTAASAAMADKLVAALPSS